MKCPSCHAESSGTAQYCSECGSHLSQFQSNRREATRTVATPSRDLTTGTTFAGRYKVVEELGKGGMGRVYRVLDMKLGEEVALKLIRSEIASNPESLIRFTNELKVSRKITHKNVGRVFEFMEKDGIHFITMEYVPGEDLKSLIHRAGPLSTARTVSIAKQICSGLAEAHQLGVIHRDLKPHNIMIDQNGDAKILDFGIARSVQTKGLTGPGVMIGTPEYMSPEQAEAKEIDARSDLYSVGIIIYEMLTGQVPFMGKTPFSVAMKHRTERPKDPRSMNPHISGEFALLVLKCLAKEKTDRFESMDELLSSLNQIENEFPLTNPQISKKDPSTSKEITVTLNLRRTLTLALMFVAAIFLAIFIWQWRASPAKPPVPERRPTIAVISFKNMTGDESYGYLQEAIPNLLITSLEQSKYLKVVTWERLRDLARQMGKEDVNLIDRDMGFELCRMDGIDAIVLGSFIKADNFFATDVKVLEIGSKRLLKSVSAKGRGVASILETQIDYLSAEISLGVGISEPGIKEPTQQIKAKTTASIQAYNAFLKGRDNLDRSFNREAIKYLDKAIKLDPTFASAYLYLAYAHAGLRNLPAEEAAYEHAMLYASRATEKERLWIQAAYARAIEKDPDKRYRILKEIIKIYPKEKRAHCWLAHIHRVKKMYVESLEGYNIALALDPEYGAALNGIATTYANLENFEQSIVYVRKFALVSPGEPGPHKSIAVLYFKMGRLDEAIAEFKKALLCKPDFGAEEGIAYIFALKEDFLQAVYWSEQFAKNAPSPGIAARGHLWKAVYCHLMGQSKQSLKSLDKSYQMWSSIDGKPGSATNVYGLSIANMLRAWINQDLGNLDEARTQISAWYQFNLNYQPEFKARNRTTFEVFMLRIDLMQGDITSAKSRLHVIESLIDETSMERPSWWVKYSYRIQNLYAEIFLAEGNSREAITFMKQPHPAEVQSFYVSALMSANLPFIKDVSARAYYAGGDLDQAIKEYEKLITFDPNSTDRCWSDPRYHYRLAKLYEEKGWKGKAIEHYKVFLELWRDADKDKIQLKDAHQRLEALEDGQ